MKMSLLTKVDNDISIHRLVQNVVYLEMPVSDRRKSFDAVLGLLLDNFPKETEGQMWKEWQKCERYLPHVFFLCRRFEEEFQGQKSIGLASLLSTCTW